MLFNINIPKLIYIYSKKFIFWGGLMNKNRMGIFPNFGGVRFS